jgi:hypothetical protein
MTQQPFLALITPIGEGASQPPSQPGYPTHPWVPPYGPSHPIAPGGPPPRPWGPIFYPDQGLPGNQPYPDQGLPGQQPGIWGPIGNYPDAGFPAPQPPMSGGGRPSHPIYYPPVIWDPSRPSNPIVNPGDPNNPAAGQGEGDRQPKIEWKSAWSPSTGWIVVGVPTGEHVTPSSEQNDQ